ncbi:MAG: tetratricopeptide repeat protein [Magnetococcus sp. XQGC-1]
MSDTSQTEQECLLLAVRCFNKGEMGQASRLAQALFASNPNHAEAVHLLGMIASRADHLDLALRLLTLAVDLRPQQASFRLHLGEVNNRLGNSDAAEGHYRQAILLQPDFVHAHVNLGNLLFSRGENEQAMAAYRAAVRLAPDTHAALYNMGIISQEQGDHEAALQLFEQALQAVPESALAHTAKAFSLLTLGRFQEGWQEYAWRWRLPDNAPRRCAQPLWDGSDPQGKRIYLYTEQGFGDALLFARFLEPLRQRGGYLILECKPELFTLFQASRLADELVVRASGDARPPDFDFDCHLPLLSLPGFFVQPDPTLAERVPYLHPDPLLCREWQARLAPLPGLRVAICWSGNPKTGVNRQRACTFAALHPLLRLPGISFISIQKGEPVQQMRAAPGEWNILDLDAELTDFAQTAAVLTQVDLLISTDTSVVHLAGGLGRPVWTLLHFAAEWRWLQQRSDSPWYPSMRLFRQQQPGDWAGVMRDVVEALATWPQPG